jgi:hypothetical protein
MSCDLIMKTFLRASRTNRKGRKKQIMNEDCETTWITAHLQRHGLWLLGDLVVTNVSNEHRKSEAKCFLEALQLLASLHGVITQHKTILILTVVKTTEIAYITCWQNIAKKEVYKLRQRLYNRDCKTAELTWSRLYEHSKQNNLSIHNDFNLICRCWKQQSKVCVW